MHYPLSAPTVTFIIVSSSIIINSTYHQAWPAPQPQQLFRPSN